MATIVYNIQITASSVSEWLSVKQSIADTESALSAQGIVVSKVLDEDLTKATVQATVDAPITNTSG